MKIKKITISVVFIILLSSFLSAIIIKPSKSKAIKTTEIFSKLIVRKKSDNVYSGQIKSAAGLAEFKDAYAFDLDGTNVNFEKEMLVFGITDDITARAYQFLKLKKFNMYILDYAETEIKYKLRKLDDGKKHSYLQVFVMQKMKGISHIRVRSLVRGGLSEVYE